METNFDTAVLIGRFQPFHEGHASLLRHAFDTAPVVVLVLGSAGSPRSPRNPFTATEREAMIRSSLDAADNSRLRVVGQRDVWDSARWAREVASRVRAASGGRTALVGFHKDASSAYLDLFPDWAARDVGRQGPLDATPLRGRILSSAPWGEVASDLAGNVPAPALDWLAHWAQGPWREDLRLDKEFVEAYATRWGKGPFVTVDALVRASGHVLLVRRGARPGKGQLALPGGFLESDEPLAVGAVRELREETGIVLDAAVPVREVVFSHPGRSARARIVTHAFLFEPSWSALPSVAGSDDAMDAAWIPEAELLGMEDRFFEDHFHILDVFLGLLSR